MSIVPSTVRNHPPRQAQSRLPISAVRCAAVLIALLPSAACLGSDEAASEVDDGFAGVPVTDAHRLPDLAFPSTEDSPAGPVSLRSVLDRPVNLIFIGFTNCPDICPVHLANLGAVLRELPLELEREVAVAFVTADPERDSLPRIHEWLDALHPGIVGFRPTRDGVNALEAALGVPVSVVDPEGEGGDYFVAHAGQILAMDDQGRVRLAYPWGIRQRDWKADLPRLIAGDWPPLPEADSAEPSMDMPGGVSVEMPGVSVEVPGVESDEMPATLSGGGRF